MEMKMMMVLLFSLVILSCGWSIFEMERQAEKPLRSPVGEAGSDISYQECMEDLEENCPHLYDYVFSLERENARLHRDYTTCTAQLKDALGGGW
jgi:hypothetical protein